MFREGIDRLKERNLVLTEDRAPHRDRRMRNARHRSQAPTREASVESLIAFRLLNRPSERIRQDVRHMGEKRGGAVMLLGGHGCEHGADLRPESFNALYGVRRTLLRVDYQREPLAEEIVDRRVRAAPLRPRHGVARDKARPIPVSCHRPSQSPLRGADVYNNLLLGYGREQAREHVDQDVDRHCQDQEVALRQEVFELRHHGIDEPELEGTLSMTRGAVPAEQAFSEPERPHVLGERSADQAQPCDTDCLKEHFVHAFPPALKPPRQRPARRHCARTLSSPSRRSPPSPRAR